MKIFNYIFLFTLLFTSCNSNSKSKMEISESSIFNLTSEWENQDAEKLQLKDLQGKTLVVVMIFTTCKSACPILVAKMRGIEEKISRKDIDKVSLVLVSIDPETDTPENLKKFAKKNKMDSPQWIFLRSSEAATQEFANVLSMKYKRISPIDFSHSNIISVFNDGGDLVSQEEGNIQIDDVVATVNKTIKK